MKRVLADRPHWRRIVRKRFYLSQADGEGFTGHVALLCLDQVREPLWMEIVGSTLT